MPKEKTKVLIVEDDPFLQSMYANKFEFEGFKTFVADDGKKALRIAVKEKPAIILLDIILPELSGFDVLKSLKSDPETAAIPVVLLTNLSQRKDVDEGLRLGAETYLIKAHFMPSEVVNKIKDILKMKQSAGLSDTAD